MRSQKEIWYNTFIIVSEPGDATHYEYMVYRDGPDDFCFMPTKNTLRFPQRLNYFDIKDMRALKDYTREEVKDININETPIMKLALEEKCNAYTLMECIRTAKILHERKMK